jgi:hypothetical protein
MTQVTSTTPSLIIEEDKKLNKASLGHLINRIKKYDADENQEKILAVLQECYNIENLKAKEISDQRRSEIKCQPVCCDGCGMNVLKGNLLTHKKSAYHKKHTTEINL